MKPAFTPRRATPMRLARWLLAAAACTALTGCLGFLKPAESTARRFVLTPVRVTTPPPVPPHALVVGVGLVRLPAYLLDTSLAVRQGTNEINYLPSTLWAERLDTGIQRVLAANLATLLPTDQIRLSTWQRHEVSTQVHLTIERFDVDTAGQGQLIAWWRILSPEGDATLQAGETRLSRAGPPPDADPSGAIATLSALLEDCSRQLVDALRKTTR